MAKKDKVRTFEMNDVELVVGGIKYIGPKIGEIAKASIDAVPETVSPDEPVTRRRAGVMTIGIDPAVDGSFTAIDIAVMTAMFREANEPKTCFLLDRETGAITPCTAAVWAAWFETADRSIAKFYEEGCDEPAVSTVFLGTDLGSFLPTDKPLLFETTILSGEKSGEQWRCSTLEEARKQHDVALARYFEIVMVDPTAERWRCG